MIYLFVLFNLSLISAYGVKLKCDSTFSATSCRCDVVQNRYVPTNVAVCNRLDLDVFPNADDLGDVNILDLSHNKIRELSKKDINRNFSKLIFGLKLSHNFISDIDSEFFDMFSTLLDLDLSHNNLLELGSKWLFTQVTNLESLDLSYNKIQVLSDGMFSECKQLKSLNLSYNPLGKFFENPMAIVDGLQLNKNLLHLSLDNVGITRIHGKCWDSFQNLKYLSVADNPLDQIPQTTKTLEYLDISGTHISELHENYLKYTKLKVLKVSRMRNLTIIAPYAFFNLDELETLVLTDSPKVIDFSETAFGLMNNKTYPRTLKHVDLGRNRLTSLNETYKFMLEAAEHVDLSFNPWHCDCNVLWFKDVVPVMRRKSWARCATPMTVTNKIINELQPDDLPSCYPETQSRKLHQTALLILTIVIIVLLAMITYLCLYSPSWSIKISRTKLAPDSPYSINNDQI